MSVLEITTSQWLEFVNTFATQGPTWRTFGRPTRWGADVDPGYGGPGRRYQLRPGADAGMLPVMGIDWRTAAMYCNWLCNGKGADPAALGHGAYDTSTFGGPPGGPYTDQPTRSPGAEFWIPSLDEWLKAAHYDPDRYGPGREGWWLYSTSSDTAPIPGLPGSGQTGAGVPQGLLYDHPLGAYPTVRSPWGLLDTSGGAGEWLEEVLYPDNPRGRGFDGTWDGSGQEISFLDTAGSFSGGFPVDAAVEGLRVASAVPTPGVASWMFALWRILSRTTRRTRCTAKS